MTTAATGAGAPSPTPRRRASAAGLARAARRLRPARPRRRRTDDASARRPRRRAPVDDTFHTFKDIKFMVVKGNDTQDQDALLNLGGGHVTIVPTKDGGAALCVDGLSRRS